MRRASALAILLAGSTAHAFVPGDDATLVVASGAQPRRARSVDSERIAGWQATRDRDTGTITQLWGSYVAVPGAMADPAIAERAARDFLARYVLPAGTRIDDFVVAANRVDDGKRTVAFAQTFDGLRVVGGQMHVVFAHDRLFAAGSAAFPNVAAPPSSLRRGPTSATRAAAWVRAPLRATGERVVLPIVRDGAVEYHVADVFDAASAYTDVYVAPDGTPLARKSRVHHATSTLQLDVGERHAMAARTQRPASELRITVDGASTTTGTDGGFAWGTTAPATVDTSVSGPRIAIVNEAGNAATATLSAQPGVPVVWSAPADEFVDAQLSAFVYASAAKAAGRRIDPNLTWLDQPLAVHVNVNSACNAFSTGDSIHFYRANASCQNTARVADVVHHEFGHSFHAQEVIPGAGGQDASITEGVADFFAANMTGDSGIGRGLGYDDKPVREIDPPGTERVYPRDLSSVSHTTGLIIGGALWDLRKQLIAKLGNTAGIAAAEQIFLGILRRAPDLTGTYMAALVADDDDGDLGNGTPNGCVIESAFGRHGLAGPQFRDTRLLAPSIDGRRVSLVVDTPTGTACPPAAVTAMTLSWRVSGGPVTEIAMTPSGVTWSAEVPALPDGTVLEYKIAATLDTVESQVFPDNPADPFYQALIGTPTEIWCERFDTDPRWVQIGGGEWEVGTSNPANSASGDPDAAFAGKYWLGTDLRGNGRYNSWIDTQIQTPRLDASAYGRVHLQFRRWLVIEDARFDVATVRVDDTEVWANARAPEGTDPLDHVDREWRLVDVDVTPFARSPLTIAWTLASNESRNLGGWNLDQVCLVGFDKLPSCDDPGQDCGGDDGGCCSTSKDGWLSSLLLVTLLGLVQFVVMFVRRR